MESIDPFPIRKQVLLCFRVQPRCRVSSSAGSIGPTSPQTQLISDRQSRAPWIFPIHYATIPLVPNFHSGSADACNRCDALASSGPPPGSQPALSLAWTTHGRTMAMGATITQLHQASPDATPTTSNNLWREASPLSGNQGPRNAHESCARGFIWKVSPGILESASSVAVLREASLILSDLALHASIAAVYSGLRGFSKLEAFLTATYP